MLSAGGEGQCGDCGYEKGPANGAGPSCACAWWGLAGGDVGRAGAFLALSDFEVHRLALIEGGIALRLDLRMVDEQIVAATGRADETKSLALVEPLYCSCCHVFIS